MIINRLSHIHFVTQHTPNDQKTKIIVFVNPSVEFKYTSDLETERFC